MLDVLIIGGGVTGCAVARLLSRYALRVALVEAADDLAAGATKANSAIVHGGYAETHHKLKGRLCYQGRRRFAALDGELNFGFKAIGSLVLAFEEEQRAGLAALMENGEKNGLEDLELLDGAQVRALEPNVNPAVRYALYCRGAGVCSPFELAYALAENARANGVRFHLNSAVTDITREPGDFFCVSLNGRHAVRARTVVNAAGLQAARVAAMPAEAGFAIRPRSGEYVLMAKGSGALVNQVLFQMPTRMGKGILVSPTVYGNLLIGPDAIDEEGDDRDTHPERLRHILAMALQTAPGLDVQRFLRSFAGVRPVAEGDDFIIGAGAVPGFINAAGIQSPGLTSSPAVAEMVRGALADAGLDFVEKPGFDPRRRAYLRPGPALDGPALQAALALPQGAEGRLLCRCEQVAERAVRDAFARGLPLATVDAAKRRTRAGMGWCQGEFCRPRTAALLSEMNGRPVDAQTDAQRQGLKRVGRQELLDYLARHPLQ